MKRLNPSRQPEREAQLEQLAGIGYLLLEPTAVNRKLVEVEVQIGIVLAEHHIAAVVAAFHMVLGGQTVMPRMAVEVPGLDSFPRNRNHHA